MSNVASKTSKKKGFQIWGSFRAANWLRDALQLRLAVLASSRSSFFNLCCGDLQWQTLRPELLKKRRFLPLQDLLRALSGLSFEMRLPNNASFGTEKQHGLASRLPKTQPSKQRNSMAWRTQEARFLTCAAVSFSVKRCGRNR